jgi:hypothetical protein
MIPSRQPHKANDPETLRCDNEPCLFHYLGICYFSCHAWQPCATHTSSPAPDQKPGCYATCPFNDLCANDIEKIKAIEAIAAKAAREQDIKILEDYRNSLDYPNCPPGDTIKRLVESLRAQQAGEP